MGGWAFARAIGATVGSVRLCDRCDGVAWLARHELGERESEQRERKRVENGQVWLGVAQDSEKESRE
jgi:hypothetical protein